MKSSKNLAILMHVCYHRDKNKVLIIQNYTVSNCLAENASLPVAIVFSSLLLCALFQSPLYTNQQTPIYSLLCHLTYDKIPFC